MNRASPSLQPKRLGAVPPANNTLQRKESKLARSQLLYRQENGEQRFSYDFSRMRVNSNGDFQQRAWKAGVNQIDHKPWSTILPLVEPNLSGLKQPDAGSDAGTPAAAPSFPNYTEVIANATVSTATATAWSETKAATTSTGRREQGFWIKYDTASSSYTCAPTFTGPTVGPDETGAADPGTKPADSGTTYTVGLFHTHTPMTYRTGSTRSVGPSSTDNTFHTANNVVGVVYDYAESPAGSGTIPAGHPLNSAAMLYSSGPTRRT